MKERKHRRHLSDTGALLAGGAGSLEFARRQNNKHKAWLPKARNTARAAGRKFGGSLKGDIAKASNVREHIIAARSPYVTEASPTRIKNARSAGIQALNSALDNGDRTLKAILEQPMSPDKARIPLRARTLPERQAIHNRKVYTQFKQYLAHIQKNGGDTNLLKAMQMSKKVQTDPIMKDVEFIKASPHRWKSRLGAIVGAGLLAGGVRHAWKNRHGRKN